VKRVAALGLRARLAVALVALAVFAVGLATLLSNRGLEPRLNAAAKARVQRSAAQLALIAADGYVHHGGFTPADTESLERLAAINGLRITIVSAAGRVIALPGNRSSQGSGRPVAAKPVIVGGTRVGSIRVSAGGSQLLTPEDVSLRQALDTLHLVAGAISVVAALVIAFVLAHTLSIPLRRARLAAEGIARGDLDIRVSPSGGAEVEALGRALNRLAETLQDEEELRKASVADLAHELRTPVAGLLSRIEAAQDHVLADEAANLEAMHAEALRLTRLLDDLSRLADAERPGMLVAKHPLDLAACAAQQADAFGQQFADRKLRLSRTLAPVFVEGDHDRLGQVVANLLSNALRYTPPGGSVRLATRREQTTAVLEVEDSGIGIAEADVPHIFKRFWRAEKSRSRATGGAGIGLAIVRELVEAHGGTIEVSSRPEAGSLFRVRLQAVAAPLARTPAQSARTAQVATID
jgi:two-component system sensor histidine kinase BaeS